MFPIFKHAKEETEFITTCSENGGMMENGQLKWAECIEGEFNCINYLGYANPSIKGKVFRSIDRLVSTVV
jgi:hypothetical protein